MRLNDGTDQSDAHLRQLRELVGDIVSKLPINTRLEYRTVRKALYSLFKTPSTSLDLLFRKFPDLKERVEDLQELLQEPAQLLLEEYRSSEEEKKINAAIVAKTIEECVSRHFVARYKTEENRQKFAAERAEQRARRVATQSFLESRRREERPPTIVADENLALAIDYRMRPPISPRAWRAQLQANEGVPEWIVHGLQDNQLEPFSDIAPFVLNMIREEGLQDPGSGEQRKDLCKKLLLLEGGRYFAAFRTASGLTTAQILSKPFEELELEFSLFKNLKMRAEQERGVLTESQIFSFSPELKVKIISCLEGILYGARQQSYLHLFYVFRNGVTLQQLEELTTEMVHVLIRNCKKSNFKETYHMAALLAYSPEEVRVALKNVSILSPLLQQGLTLDQIFSMESVIFKRMRQKGESLLTEILQSYTFERVLSIYRDEASLRRVAFSLSGLPEWLFHLQDVFYLNLKACVSFDFNNLDVEEALEILMSAAPLLLTTFTRQQLTEPGSPDEKIRLFRRLCIIARYPSVISDFLRVTGYQAIDLLNTPETELELELILVKVLGEASIEQMERAPPLGSLFPLPLSLKTAILSYQTEHQEAFHRLGNVLLHGFSVQELVDLQQTNEPMFKVLINDNFNLCYRNIELPKLIRLYDCEQIAFLLEKDFIIAETLYKTPLTLTELLDGLFALPEQTREHILGSEEQLLERVTLEREKGLHPNETFLETLLKICPPEI